MEKLSDIQIKNVLNSLNFSKDNTHVEYNVDDIKYGHPNKTMSCYVIMQNFNNKDMPSVFYGGHKNGKFFKCSASGGNVFTSEAYMGVLGYVEYKQTKN